MRFGLSERPNFDYRLRFRWSTEIPVFAAAVRETIENIGEEAAAELPYIKEWRSLRPGKFNAMHQNLAFMEQTATLLGNFALSTDDTVLKIIDSRCAPHQDPDVVASEREAYGKSAISLSQQIRDGLGRHAIIGRDDAIARECAVFLASQISGGGQRPL